MNVEHYADHLATGQMSDTIGRMFMVDSSNTELSAFRKLLYNAVGPTCFQDEVYYHADSKALRNAFVQVLIVGEPARPQHLYDVNADRLAEDLLHHLRGLSSAVDRNPRRV